eukprot:716849-Amorphochlora_amoeboformis.AAC.1
MAQTVPHSGAPVALTMLQIRAVVARGTVPFAIQGTIPSAFTVAIAVSVSVCAGGLFEVVPVMMCPQVRVICLQYGTIDIDPRVSV